MDLQHLDDKSELTDNIEEARRLYEAGAKLWREGDRAGAITAYTSSATLDPQGPGATALELITGIMDFYDTNQYNP